MAWLWSALAISLFIAVASTLSVLLIADSRNEANRQRQLVLEEKNAATNQRDRAISEQNRARRSQYFAEIVAGQMEIDQRNIVGPRGNLVGHLPLPKDQDHRDWEWYYLMSLCHPEEHTLRDVYATFATWSPDGKLIGGSGIVWDATSGARLANVRPANALRLRTAWSPDGQQLAWGVASSANSVYICNRATCQTQRFGRH